MPEKKSESLEKQALEFLAQKASQDNRVYILGTLLGIIVGAIFCLSGLIITILGFSGAIEWFFKAGTFQSKLGNAGPGVFFALLGMIILWRYKPKLKTELITPKLIYTMKRKAPGGGRP